MQLVGRGGTVGGENEGEGDGDNMLFGEKKEKRKKKWCKW